MAGSEPYNITGTAGTSAVQIPAGGKVTSAAVCVDPTRDKVRFFLRNVSNSRTRLKVEALFVKDGATRASTVSVGYVTTPVGVWQPSPILKNQVAKYIPAGSTGKVNYRFSAENGSVVYYTDLALAEAQAAAAATPDGRALKLDVTNPADIAAAIRQVTTDCGRLDRCRRIGTPEPRS